MFIGLQKCNHCILRSFVYIRNGVFSSVKKKYGIISLSKYSSLTNIKTLMWFDISVILSTGNRSFSISIVECPSIELWHV